MSMAMAEKSIESFDDARSDDEMMTDSNNRSNDDEKKCRLAQNVCEAMQKGDKTELYSILEISLENDESSNKAAGDSASPPTDNNKCRELLSVFRSLIGNTDQDVGRLDLPLSVRVHIVLRALLQIPSGKYAIPWGSAKTAIQSLQYYANSHHNKNHHSNSSTLSHGEELAMVAEIRSFVTSLQNEKVEKEFVNQTIKHLLELGNAILEPLKMKANSEELIKCEQTKDLEADQVVIWRRRPNSYLLPLELIPVILAAADCLDDLQLGFNVENEKRLKSKEDDVMIAHPEEVKHEDGGGLYIRASDRLLSSMFASCIDGDSDDDSTSKLQRNMRADASLPLLSLAMDDIGSSRMSTILPLHEGVTYWDCLIYAFNDAINANLLCYSDGFESDDGMRREAKEQILDEAVSNEGAHIIPLSDYPALMRCICRMVATSSSSNTSWEYVLLRLYHAAAVATCRTPSFYQRKMYGEADRLATLSTVESHVLLPSCTGASVSTIKSLLEACMQNCCPSCKTNAKGEMSGVVDLHVHSNAEDVVPTWAVAGVVLLIMRARASKLIQSGTSSNFGPRAVFRMASDMMRKIAQDSNSQNKRHSTGFGSDDEVGYALKVLLHLSGVNEGKCRVCSDDRFNEDTEKSAYDVLKYSYYSENDQFLHRYPRPDTGNNSYRHQLGLHTISAYSNLVRASLNHGALHKARKSTDSFIEDIARTWIDAANMLLEESTRSPTPGKLSSSAPDGTAMAIVIITVIFFEVPSSQNGIIRSIYGRLANMASHNTSNSDRQSEEPSFVLISTLAWSLISSDGKHSSIDVVRGKGPKCQNDQVTSVLGPLCNLLSKSSMSHDQHLNGILTYSSNDAPHLSHGTLRRLARALVPATSGREFILAMAQKNMRVLTASAPYSNSLTKASFFEFMPSTPSGANDSIYLAIDCLCSLVEKCHPSANESPDDCGQTALRLLTDIIILQRPSSPSGSPTASCVPIKVVSWLLSQLNVSARLGKLSMWASRRLLRACFVGLLKFTALGQSSLVEYDSFLLPTSIFSMTCSSSVTMRNGTNEDPDCGTSSGQLVTFEARHDVPGMLRFAVSLYNDIVAKSHRIMLSSIDQSLLESHALLKPHLLRKILGRSHTTNESINVDASAKDAMDQLFKEGKIALQRGFDPSDDSLGSVIDAIFLIIFMNGAAAIVKENHDGSFEGDWMANLNEYLYEAETYYYLQESVGKIRERGLPLPSWIEARSPRKRCHESVMKSDESLLNCAEFKLFHMSLCDILVEILLQNWAHHDRVRPDNHTHDISIMRSVNLVVGSKRRANELVEGPSTKKIFMGGMPCNSICFFLQLSAQHLRSLLSASENKEDALAEVDILIKNVLDLCKVILSKRTLHGISSQSQILSSLWNLYCSLADEESSQLLCIFVKESYVEIGHWADEERMYDIDESSFTLLSITSPTDLDYHVRYLRQVLLSALSHVLTSIPASQSVISIAERKSTLGLLLLMLPQMCQDLDAGFQGYSGGLTKRLILLFLDVINKSIDSMATLFGVLPASAQHQIKSSFVSVHQSAVIIWEGFRENSLQQASVIKGALRLCIDKMPNMVRRIERIVDECIINKPLYKNTCDVLHQCLLSSGNKAKKNASTAGAVSRSDGSNVVQAKAPDVTKISSLDSTAEIDNDEDKVLALSKEKSENESNNKGESNTSTEQPTFASATLLSWAFNCAFVAVANTWNDSYRIISGNEKLSKQRVEGSEKALVALILHRIEDMSSLHTALCRVFEVEVKPEDVVAEEAKGDSRVSSKLFAESLSYYGKFYLCASVEKISITLTLSVKQVVKYFTESSNLGQGRLCNPKLKESIICLQGLLHSAKSSESKHDIITGTLKWYINEKRNFGKGGNEDFRVLGRLPRVLFRLEGLDAELRKLDDLVADLIYQNNDASRRKMHDLDEITKAMMKGNSNGEEEITFRELLRQWVEKVESFKNAMRINEMGTSGEAEGDGFTGNGKRRNQHFSPLRKSRKISLRSRNDTVDDWLAMDDEEFGSATGEKHNADDAFVDLEDFIVEG